MKFRQGLKKLVVQAFVISSFLTTLGIGPSAAKTNQQPNIVFIMGDDIGWMQPSIYHEGLMVGETRGWPALVSPVFGETRQGFCSPTAGNATAFAKNAKGWAKKGIAAGRALSISSLREVRLATGCATSFGMIDAGTGEIAFKILKGRGAALAGRVFCWGIV